MKRNLITLRYLKNRFLEISLKLNKYQGKAIIIETKEKREPKKLANREEDAIRVLSSRGIENPAQVYKEMMEARKGELSEKRLLKIKPI